MAKIKSSQTTVGSRASISPDTLENSTAIGQGSTSTKSNQVVVGNPSVTETLVYGSLGLGASPTAARRMFISGPVTGSTSGRGILSSPEVQSDITANFRNFYSVSTTPISTFSLGEYAHFSSDQGTLGAGSSIINQYGFAAFNTMTGATNNYGFMGFIPEGTGRWNFYASGSANNYMNGRLSIGTQTYLGTSVFSVNRNISGAATAYGILQDGTIQSDVITNAYGVYSKLRTQATAFTIGNANAFYADNITVGSGSTVTNAYAFRVPSSFTTGGNNYGFHSAIPANGLLNWHFYGNGTAHTYLGGNLALASTNGLTSRRIQMGGSLTGGTATNGFFMETRVDSDVTAAAEGFATSISTQAASFNLASLTHFRAGQAAIGAGSSITNQYGFRCNNTLIGATSNFGFYSDIPAASGRWNFYASGTANNYLAGSLGIGSTSITGYNLKVDKPMTGGVNTYGITAQGAIQSDSTTSARYFESIATTVDEAFTVTNLYHYVANQNAFGASSTVTNQTGYMVLGDLVGATNNYGFRGELAEAANVYNIYMNGTADNLVNGNFMVGTAGKGLRVKEGSNAKQGVATLVAGSVVVANTSVTANSRIFLTSQADGGTPGWLRVSTRSAGVSFTITSSSGTDTSTVAYQIFEPA